MKQKENQVSNKRSQESRRIWAPKVTNLRAPEGDSKKYDSKESQTRGKKRSGDAGGDSDTGSSPEAHVKNPGAS